MDEITQLTAFCVRLGSTPAQAGTMARQLSKRADQLAKERGISREEAMAYLLRLVTQGHRGEAPGGFGAPSPSSE